MGNIKKKKEKRGSLKKQRRLMGEAYLKNIKHSSLHLERKSAGLVDLRHNLYVETHNYCSLLRTYHVCQKMSQQTFAPNEGFWDQYQYLGNCPPTPPLTQH